MAVDACLRGCGTDGCVGEFRAIRRRDIGACRLSVGERFEETQRRVGQPETGAAANEALGIGKRPGEGREGGTSLAGSSVVTAVDREPGGFRISRSRADRGTCRMHAVLRGGGGRVERRHANKPERREWQQVCLLWACG